MSDIAGYRSDGGGLGQDQGLTQQLRGILTAKLPLLSAPGTVLENSLYYDVNSSSVTAVEEQATFAKDRIALNNFTYGSTPSAYIPSVLFANNVFWVIQFPVDIVWPAAENPPNPNANHLNIPDGWGFNALQSLIVYMGASSIAQIQIGALTNFLVAMACCETYNKRAKCLEGAGRYLNNVDDSSLLAPYQAGQLIFRMKSYGAFFTPEADQTNPAAAAPWLAQAVVPLRLPWSSMAALDKRLSLDTKLSTQPIQISIQTSTKEQMFDAGANIYPLFGTQWKSSTIQLWQEELSDKSLSVRNELLAMPEFNVGYPFQYAQSIPFTVSSTASNDDGTSSYLFTMNITSIINSDLTTFLFNVSWAPRVSNSAQSGQFCPLYGEELIDFTLLLNGQRFFAFDGDSYPYVTLAKQLDDPNYEIFVPSANMLTSAGASSSAFAAIGNYYELNNSRLRSIIAESHMQNTARFTNQTFQLQFKINRSSYYLLPTPAADPDRFNYSNVPNFQSGYQLNMTYLYNAVYLIGGDGGTTKLITN